MSKLHAIRTVRRLFSQDVARANAAQASVRLQHLRRQRRDLESYLEEQPDPSIGGRPARAAGAPATARPARPPRRRTRPAP